MFFFVVYLGVNPLVLTVPRSSKLLRETPKLGASFRAQPTRFNTYREVLTTSNRLSLSYSFLGSRKCRDKWLGMFPVPSRFAQLQHTALLDPRH